MLGVWLMMGMMLTMDRPHLSGRVLAGRYRLGHPLAAGSGGRTYVAHDLRLDRRVAVKILHEGLAAEPGFLERFRAEAKTVASLNHRHIVTLHDWGEEPVPYMVFELLTGGSLAALLASGTRLTPAQACRLGTQVAAALDHAHERGLVHRDIKPGNLLFADDGNVRVADFGLARALAESSMTEPLDGSSGIVGTARYAPPEVASGGALDPTADLYSLALVLVEAVTGEVPLTGETPVATLTARANSPLVSPIEMGPLGVPVERAGLPYAVERYPSARVMQDAFEAAAGMLPDPSPLALPGLEVDLDEPEPTEMAPLAVDQTAVEEAVESPEAEPDPAPDAPDDSATGRRLVPWVVSGVIALALAAAALAVSGATTPLVHAPNLLGATEDDARAALDDADLDVTVAERVTAPEPAGTVLRQSPGPGDALKSGTAVSVVLSAGPPPVELPAVVGQQEDDGIAALEAAGFLVNVDRRYDDVDEGTVILQEPASEEAPRGAEVTVVVSDGPEPVVLPNVVGKTSDEARSILEDAGFEVVAAEEFSDTVDEGKVIRQDPVTGAEAVPGSETTIVVSKGPNRVLIPDVRGMGIDEASGELESAGFEVDVIGYSPGSLVKRMDPEPGLMLERGRTVTLFF